MVRRVERTGARRQGVVVKRFKGKTLHPRGRRRGWSTWTRKKEREKVRARNSPGGGGEKSTVGHG